MAGVVLTWSRRQRPEQVQRHQNAHLGPPEELVRASVKSSVGWRPDLPGRTCPAPGHPHTPGRVL